MVGRGEKEEEGRERRRGERKGGEEKENKLTCYHLARFTQNPGPAGLCY